MKFIPSDFRSLTAHKDKFLNGKLYEKFARNFITKKLNNLPVDFTEN